MGITAASMVHGTGSLVKKMFHVKVCDRGSLSTYVYCKLTSSRSTAIHISCMSRMKEGSKEGYRSVLDTYWYVERVQ
jgi:hypothetical protein